MKLVTLVAFVLTTVLPASDQSTQIDLLSIAEKPMTEIEKVLGKPTHTDQFRSRDSNCLCNRYYYMKDQVSIVYIDNKADWIQVNSPAQLINVDKAHVMEFQNWHTHVLVKLRKTRNDDCCLAE